MCEMRVAGELTRRGFGDSVLISSGAGGGAGSTEGCRDVARRRRRFLGGGGSSGGIDGSSGIELGTQFGNEVAEVLARMDHSMFVLGKSMEMLTVLYIGAHRAGLRSR